MGPLEIKAALLLNSPEFVEDLEKTAALIGLSQEQKADVVIKLAGAMSLDRIVKLAEDPPAPMQPPGYPPITDASVMKNPTAFSTVTQAYFPMEQRLNAMNTPLADRTSVQAKQHLRNLTAGKPAVLYDAQHPAPTQQLPGGTVAPGTMAPGIMGPGTK